MHFGSRVATTSANPDIKDWEEGVNEQRQWGVDGTIIKEHNSHGLCFAVKHNDGSVGYYDPSELLEI